MNAASPLDPEALQRLSVELRNLAAELAVQKGMNTGDATGISAPFVQSIIKARKLRRRHIGADLFGDPAWDMMLDLLAARLTGQKLYVSSLGLAAGLPPTTALRWVHMLEERGLIVRIPDEKDGRRVYVALADDAAANMESLLLDMRRTSGAVI